MRITRLSIAVMFLAILAGCGGYGGSVMRSTQPSPSPTPAPAASPMNLLSIGDSPSDRILAFEVTINSISLTDANGNTVTVFNTPTRIELSHLAGTFVPLVSFSVPAGSYTSLIATFANAEIEVLNPDGTTSEQKPPLSVGTFTTALSPNLLVGSGSVAVNVDFNVAQSVTFDSAGNATVTPVLTVTTGNAARAEDDDNGKVDDAHGTVGQVNASSFTMMVHDGNSTLTINVDSNTIFKGVTGIAGLMSGMQVEVSAALQSDGSLLATKIEAEVEVENEQNAMEVEGQITNVIGSPVSQISIVARDGSATNDNAPALGSTVTATIDDNTKFEVAGNINLGGLAFSFDRSTINPGQNVEVDSDGNSAQSGDDNGGNGGTVTALAARKIKLQEQALTGTVSAVQGNTFNLTVDAGSTFAMLNGTQTVIVNLTSDTQLKGISAITDGATVRIRGLLFFDGTNFQFVAEKVSLP